MLQGSPDLATPHSRSPQPEHPLYTRPAVNRAAGPDEEVRQYPSLAGALGVRGTATSTSGRRGRHRGGKQITGCLTGEKGKPNCHPRSFLRASRLRGTAGHRSARRRAGNEPRIGQHHPEVIGRFVAERVQLGETHAGIISGTPDSPIISKSFNRTSEFH